MRFSLRSQTTVRVSVSGDGQFYRSSSRGDQACRSDSSGLEVSISYLIEIAGFISRLGSVPLVIVTEL